MVKKNIVINHNIQVNNNFIFMWFKDSFPFV